MGEGVPIEFDSISKHFGAVKAVSELSFRVEPGHVTGFLGPNGAGKTTTLRMLLGLVQPTAGTATIGGTPYHRLEHPLGTVGAALEASSFTPGRTARNHLRVYAQAARLAPASVQTAIDRVGLTDYADRRVAGYSLGMRQRLGLAFALLGDPGVLVLDEPTNGLDPEGIRWIRTFLHELAREGRTVLVSSHLLSEVQQSVDQVVIIAKGTLMYDGDLAGLDPAGNKQVLVDSPDRDALAAALSEAGAEYTTVRTGLLVSGMDTAEVGRLAYMAHLELHLLQKQKTGLEESFLHLVGEEGAL